MREVKQLLDQGFFVNSDGVKSTDLRVKVKKGPRVIESEKIEPKSLEMLEVKSLNTQSTMS